MVPEVGPELHLVGPFKAFNVSLLVGQAYLLYVVAGRVLTIKVTCCDRFYIVLLYIMYLASYRFCAKI